VQAVHVPPSGPVYPALHVHAAADVAAVVVKYVSTAQSVHASVPAAVLYFPAGHSVQDPVRNGMHSFAHSQHSKHAPSLSH